MENEKKQSSKEDNEVEYIDEVIKHPAGIAPIG